MKHSTVATLLVSGLMSCGIMIATWQSVPSYAHSESAQSELAPEELAQNSVETDLLQEVVPLQAPLLERIREAPWSELFTVTIPNGATGYGVKDKDFDTEYDGVGFYSLWGDIPDNEIFQAAMFYCFRNPDLANSSLEAVIIEDGEQPLVTIDQKVISTEALNVEVTPERYETIDYYIPSPAPFWGGVYSDGPSQLETIYIPAQNCSVGGGRFDLASVKDDIAQLPNETLNVRLIFDNGLTERWRLGQGTVEQLKRLPSLQ